MDIDTDFIDNIKACRTCGIHYVAPAKNQLKHLFQSCQEHSEINLIRLELSQWNIQVAENDGFPQYVCNTCIHQFEQVFQLRAACINAQNEFCKFYAVPNGNVPNIKIKTELPELDEVPSICDFIYVDELSDTEYDGAVPFNFPHIPIKAELIEAADIPVEESVQPTNVVESASRVVQTERSSSYIHETLSQNESAASIQPAAVVQMDANVVQCNLCQHGSSNQEEHKQHMLIDHGLQDLECHICGKEFKDSTSARLKFHMKWHTLNKQVNCTLCGFVCHSKEVLKKHSRVNHRKLICKVCGKGVLSKKMKSHLRQHETNSKYSCEYCADAFATENERENHIWQIHANEDNTECNSMATFQPHYSQTTSENSFNVQQEEIICQGPQEHVLFKFVCAHCEHRFINQIDLETHVNEEHRAYLVTVEPHNGPHVENARINENGEMTQTEEEANEQDNITVFEEHNNASKIHIPSSDSSSNNSILLQQNFSLPTFLPDLVNQTEKFQSVTNKSAPDEDSGGEESENEAKWNMTSYLDCSLNTFACAKCTETFVSIEQLRKHYEQHLAADQQEVKKSPSKLKFQCHFCVKSFDLKFSLNRHIKKHKHAPL